VILLGFDTATRATAVALRLADGSTLRARDDPTAQAHPGHATRLLSMADELLARAGVGWAALQRIAVGRGPGRFTGLRVGVATARGLAQSLSAELVGVSTLRALAEPVLASAANSEGVLAVIDALRGEVFAAGYTAAGAGAVRELALPHPLRAEQLSEAIRAAGGSRRACWVAVGDGAVRYRAELERAGWEVPGDASPQHAVDGGAVCELAERARPAASCEELVPDYRRRPDAEAPRAVRRGDERVAEPQGATR
jgi:tRNA threonylcarbamoyladenosine biosynthesis protein TsaB